MAEKPEMTDTIDVALTDDDTGQVLWGAQLVWKGGHQAGLQSAGPIDLDDPNQTLIDVKNVVWSPAFRALQSEPKRVRAGAAEAAAGLALDVAKFAWEIIKDSRPVTQANGAFTSVLATADTGWDHYSEAKEFKSRKFDWHGKNLFGMTLFRVKYLLEGTYNARYSGSAGNVPRGQYLPLIFFDIPEAFAAFSWSLSGAGSSSNPSNMGGAASVVPMVYVSAKFTAHGWFQSFTKSFSYQVRGDTGYAGEA